MSHEDYLRMKRWIIGILAVVLWIVSNNFSIDGFGRGVNPDPSKVWVAWALSLTITGLELLFNGLLNTPGKNWTIWIAGIFAYAYGIISNYMGVESWRGAAVNPNPINIVFMIALAVLPEILPEPFLVYALTGRFQGAEGDILQNIVKMRKDDKDGEREPHESNNNGQKGNNNQGKQNNNNQQNNNRNNNRNDRNDQQNRREDPRMNGDMEDDGFIPLDDRAMGRVARQNQGKHQQPQQVHGGSLKKNDNHGRNLRG